MAFFGFAFFLAFQFLVNANDDGSPCPFNTDCFCVDITTDSFSSIECSNVESIPVFSGANKRMYQVQDLTVSGKIDKIPRDAFAQFEIIHTLILDHQSDQDSEKIDWDDEAFNEVTIHDLRVNQLNIFSLPQAVRSLAPSLRSLSLENCASPIVIRENEFQDFSYLDELLIYQSPIEKINDQGFTGLEGLMQLSLVSTSITELPDQTLDNLQKLSLQNNSLTKIPSIVQSPRLVNIWLSDNRIESISAGDFERSKSLRFINLSNNPIKNIDIGALDPLPINSLYLDNISISSLDMSIFRNATFLEHASFSKNPFLKILTISDLNRIHFQNVSGIYVSLENTSVEVVDPKIDRLLAIYPFLRFRISSTNLLNCVDDMAWIAKRYFCDETLLWTGKCSNGMPLNEYLAQFWNQKYLSDCGVAVRVAKKVASKSIGFSFTILFLITIIEILAF